MDIDEIKSEIRHYLEVDMVFSAKLLCEKLITIEDSEYWQFQYANILRMCTLFSKSEEIFLNIDVDRIPPKYKYYYHLYLGHLFMDVGNKQNAKAEFKKCMEFEECDTIPYVYIASLLLGEEDNYEAIFYLKEALNKDGDLDEVYYNLANRFAINGEFDLALGAIDSCLRLDPEYPNGEVVRKDILEYNRIKT